MFRIYPDESQKVMFEKTFGCVRFIYNKMLSDKIQYYEETKQMLKNTPAQYKKEYEWLKEVDSLALANAQLHLESAYKNFFRRPKVGYPKYKSKHKGERYGFCKRGRFFKASECYISPIPQGRKSFRAREGCRQ